MRLATRADELKNHEDAGVLDTLARAYSDSGQIRGAVEIQARAVEKADDDLKPQLRETLKRYESGRQKQMPPP